MKEFVFFMIAIMAFSSPSYAMKCYIGKHEVSCNCWEPNLKQSGKIKDPIRVPCEYNSKKDK